LPKTSVHMILRTMERFAFVERQPPRGSYRLGNGVRKLLENFGEGRAVVSDGNGAAVGSK